MFPQIHIQHNVNPIGKFVLDTINWICVGSLADEFNSMQAVEV